MNGYSEYIVFVDESGGPTLKEIDPQYPLLVLAFMIVKKADYSKVLCPAVQAFKFAHFGHDQVILHERDIRRDSGVFTFLKSRERKEAFLNELTDIVAAAPFQLVAVVIRKDLLKARYAYPANPYHLALEYGLERVAAFLRQQSVWMEKLRRSSNPTMSIRAFMSSSSVAERTRMTSWSWSSDEYAMATTSSPRSSTSRWFSPTSGQTRQDCKSLIWLLVR